jgi:hypothetical protein
MLEVLPSPDHVVAVRVAGVMEVDEYRKVIAEVEAKLARHPKIGVLVDLTAFTDATLEAAGEDLRYSLGNRGRLRLGRRSSGLERVSV